MAWLEAIVDFIGIGKWCIGWLVARQNKKAAQAVADTPMDKTELLDTLEHHDL